MILLRRPPTLSYVDEPFVPERASIDEIDARWADLQRMNPLYHDGPIVHVLGVHRNGCGGARLHVLACSYRYYAVQDDALDVGCRSLGVKGLAERDGRWLLGRRSDRVSGYPGQWEFAPGGAVEPGIEPAAAIAMELDEETGLDVTVPPTAVALLFDETMRSWEVVFRLRPGPGEAIPAADEYQELRWCEPDDLPAPLTPVAAQMRELLP